MKIGTMLTDVVTSLFKKPVTERYPQVRKKTPEHLRGQLIWHPSKCTGCELCVMDCPAGAIKMTVVDKSAKRFVLCYHLDRCLFCAQCVQSCRHGCLEMSADDWELAALDKQTFTLYFGEDQDVREVLDGQAAPAARDPSNK
jgi:formate hydrogenlyase subunit 6/NADH:ubiquinone oxidoreductase subunit I